MMRFSAVLICGSLILSCAHSPDKPPQIVKEPVYVTPPEALTQNCESPDTPGTFGSELQRLSALVDCERGDKSAMRAWIEKITNKGETAGGDPQ